MYLIKSIIPQLNESEHHSAPVPDHNPGLHTRTLLQLSLCVIQRAHRLQKVPIELCK